MARWRWLTPLSWCLFVPMIVPLLIRLGRIVARYLEGGFLP